MKTNKPLSPYELRKRGQIKKSEIEKSPKVEGLVKKINQGLIDSYSKYGNGSEFAFHMEDVEDLTSQERETVVDIFRKTGDYNVRLDNGQYNDEPWTISVSYDTRKK